MAPIASNITESVQSSSSQPPANTMSCLPMAICSKPAPMQWVEVAHARGDGIVHPACLEPGRQHRRRPRAHRLGHRERTDALGTLGARRFCRLDYGSGGGAAGADDQAGLVVRQFGGRKPGVGDGLLHGDMGVAQAWAEEAGRAAVHQRLPAPALDLRRRVHLAAEAEFGVLRRGHHARARLAQRGGHLRGGRADGGDDPDPGDRDAPHGQPSPCLCSPQTRSLASNRPTRRSLAL